jgi:hypothetical protein
MNHLLLACALCGGHSAPSYLEAANQTLEDPSPTPVLPVDPPKPTRVAPTWVRRVLPVTALAAGELALGTTGVVLRKYPFRRYGIDVGAATLISALILYGPFVTPQKLMSNGTNDEEPMAWMFLGVLSPMVVVLATEALQDFRQFRRDGAARGGALGGWLLLGCSPSDTAGCILRGIICTGETVPFRVRPPVSGTERRQVQCQPRQSRARGEAPHATSPRDVPKRRGACGCRRLLWPLLTRRAIR